MIRSSDRGAAAVELALILPILLLLVFGIVDFGRMLNAQISLTEAAREGARAATVGASNAATAQSRVNLINSSYTVDTSKSSFCPSSPSAGDTTTVVVTYSFDFITPVGDIAGIFGGGGFGGPITITGTGVMPCIA